MCFYVILSPTQIHVITTTVKVLNSSITTKTLLHATPLYWHIPFSELDYMNEIALE